MLASQAAHIESLRAQLEESEYKLRGQAATRRIEGARAYAVMTGNSSWLVRRRGLSNTKVGKYNTAEIAAEVAI